MENCLTFPVSRQSFQVLELCRAANKACDLIHGICQGHKEAFFGNPRAIFESSQTPHQGILHSWNQSATGGIPCETSTERPVAMADQQRLQISQRHFDKFPTPIHVFMLEDKISNPSKFLFQFSLGGNVKDQRIGDAEFKVKLISRILRCWTRRLRLL